MLAVCLILVVISLIMTLNAMTRLEILRKQNDLLSQHMQKLQSEHNNLLSQTQAKEWNVGVEIPTTEQSDDKTTELSPEALLQQQMEAFQTVLSAYATNHAGKYPTGLSSLIDFANRHGFQQVVNNPYTEGHNPLVSEDLCLDITHDPADEGLSEHAGRLLYQAHLDPDGEAISYTLAAFDQQGFLIKDKQGEVLTLNSAD